MVKYSLLATEEVIEKSLDEIVERLVMKESIQKHTQREKEEYQIGLEQIEEINRILSLKELNTIVEKVIDAKIHAGELVKPTVNKIKEIESKIVELFDDIDFVKQVYYRHRYEGREIYLDVIYDHDDYEYSFNIMFQAFTKLLDIFPDVYMDLEVSRPSEIEQDDITNSIPALKGR